MQLRLHYTMNNIKFTYLTPFIVLWGVLLITSKSIKYFKGKLWGAQLYEETQEKNKEEFIQVIEDL